MIDEVCVAGCGRHADGGDLCGICFAVLPDAVQDRMERLDPDAWDDAVRYLTGRP